MSQDELFPGARIERTRREVNSADNRHELFIAAYLENGHNATQAAIAAGYSERTAKQQGSRLLQQPEIAERLAERAEEVAAGMIASARETLESATKILRYDARRMVNRHGVLRTITEMDDAEAHAIEGFEFDKKGLIRKVRFASRSAARDQMMRHHALYRDKMDVQVGIATVVLPALVKDVRPELPAGPEW